MAGEMAALAALMLPVAGVVVRWIAFKLDEADMPALAIALSTSLPHLATTGLLALGELWPVLAAIPFFVLAERRHISGGRHQMPEWTKTREGRLLAGIFAIMGALTLVFSRPWPVIPAVMAFGFVSGAYVAHLGGTGRLTFGHTWPIVISGVMLGALIAPLTGRVAALPGGYYSIDVRPKAMWLYELGRTDTIVYFRTCNGDEPLVEAVRPSDVRLATFEARLPRKSPGTSLWDMLRGKPLALGVQYPCPLDTVSEQATVQSAPE